MSQFLDELDVEDIDDTNFRVINHPFRYQSDLVGLITVPVGLLTDFASTWSHKYAKKPGVVHDWLYYSALYDRGTADSVLREAMKANGNWFLMYPYWLGVRIFGWQAWDSHRAAGHSAKDFPNVG